MKKYKQLNQEKRCQIGTLLETGKTKSEIADIIGVHKCTISRELCFIQKKPPHGQAHLVFANAKSNAEKPKELALSPLTTRQ